jgi:hypothetical protein
MLRQYDKKVKCGRILGAENEKKPVFLAGEWKIWGKS